jgi:hypothetical protein
MVTRPPSGEGDAPVAFRMEQRAGRRFPLMLHVDYRLFLNSEGRVLSQGKGQTIDISHTGVLLNVQEPYPVGAAADLSIEWPAPAEGGIALQLRLIGSVVRSDNRGTAFKILRYGFKRGQGEFLSTHDAWPGISKAPPS